MKNNESWKDTSEGLPAAIGEYYEAEVPDTLDLAEHAKLSVHHFISVMDENNDYQALWQGNSERMFHAGDIYAICHPKMMEALAMARYMSGSRLGVSKEAQMLEHTMALIGEEGLWWTPEDVGSYPWLGAKEINPHMNPTGGIRMMMAMMMWYQYTGKPVWKNAIDKMIDAHDKIIFAHEDDYAYIPLPAETSDEDLSNYFMCDYIKGKGWNAKVGEPQNEKNVAGCEGSSLGVGVAPGVFATWYGLTGNKRALRLSGELARFYTKPRFWADWKGGDYPGVVGAEHAHWHGHVHSYYNTLRAVLEYAVAANDPKLKAWVRDGYEWARQPTLSRYGFVGDCQGCGCARLTALAVKLSLAGVGDYWEDVDIFMRNMIVEMQFVPEDLSGIDADKAMKKEGIGVTSYEAMLGSYSRSPFKEDWAMCCSPHGAMGLFYCWYGALQYNEGTAQVNLLINRASPWLDMESWLPYEGNIIIHNKKCSRVIIRIPIWAELGKVKFYVNNRMARPRFMGKYACLEGLSAHDIIMVELPVYEWTENLTGPDPKEWMKQPVGCWFPQEATKEPITFKLKANTIVDISHPILPGAPFNDAWWRIGYNEGEKPKLWDAPLFMGRRKQFLESGMKMKNVERFVTERSFIW